MPISRILLSKINSIDIRILLFKFITMSKKLNRKLHGRRTVSAARPTWDDELLMLPEEEKGIILSLKYRTARGKLYLSPRRLRFLSHPIIMRISSNNLYRGEYYASTL